VIVPCFRTNPKALSPYTKKFRLNPRQCYGQNSSKWCALLFHSVIGVKTVNNGRETKKEWVVFDIYMKWRDIPPMNHK